MRKALLLSFALMLVAGTAFSQGGSVSVFGDIAGSTCNITDTPGGTLKTYYVVHKATNVYAAQFRAKLPTCFVGTYLSDTAVFGVTVGNSQTGVSVAYGACLSGNIHNLKINLFVQAATPTCCYWTVDADPSVASGRIEVSDCDFNTIYGDGGQAIFNSLPTCDCNVPSEDTTWGQVKALFE